MVLSQQRQRQEPLLADPSVVERLKGLVARGETAHINIRDAEHLLDLLERAGLAR